MISYCDRLYKDFCHLTFPTCTLSDASEEIVSEGPRVFLPTPYKSLKKTNHKTEVYGKEINGNRGTFPQNLKKTRRILFLRDPIFLKYLQ